VLSQLQLIEVSLMQVMLSACNKNKNASYRKPIADPQVQTACLHLSLCSRSTTKLGLVYKESHGIKSSFVLLRLHL